MHVSMEKKPLCRYDPHSYRNRLPIEECRIPANNASGVIIGDRTYFILLIDIKLQEVIWVKVKMYMVILEKSIIQAILELVQETHNGYMNVKLNEQIFNLIFLL